MQLDYLLWPQQPGLRHMHSLLWLAALIYATAMLYRETLGATWLATVRAVPRRPPFASSFAAAPLGAIPTAE